MSNNDFKTALKYAMDLLARRSHSQKELKEKLLSKRYEEKAIQQVILWCQEQNWLEDPYYLSQKVYKELSQKHKGYLYIKKYWEQKGLPELPFDAKLEYDKCIALIDKLTRVEKLDNIKLQRRLFSRGFMSETIQSALNEEGHSDW